MTDMFLERHFDPAVGAHALFDTDPQAARHQWVGAGEAEVIAFRLQAFAHFQYVAVAGRSQQTDGGALSLQQGVRRDGGAMDDVFGFRQQRRD